ncbi:MAG TPA: nicotinate phosphoribosyltransferase, partial [Nitrospiria bacterium]|nr:nicotinate phosphoribosyltransferase [Nitrospiria bacterium]
PRLRQSGIRIKAVRLDSGNLEILSRKVRKILDEGGAKETGIFASGNLDEHIVARLVASGAPIDGYGVGTRLLTSNDSPYLDCAYKLQEYAGKPRRKRSEGKATWPGRKAVFRYYEENGTMERDFLTLAGKTSDGESLLETFMTNGKRVKPAPSLKAIRDFASAELKRLPLRMKQLVPGAPYKVEISPALLSLAREVDLMTAEERP